MRLQTYLVTLIAVGMILGSLVSFMPKLYPLQLEDKTSDVPLVEDFDSINPVMDFSLSEITSGVFDPILIEQTGYVSTGSISARTDSFENTVANLSIDDDNNWVGSRAEIDITNLERLYVNNGSFSDGISGQNLYPNGAVSAYPYGWSSISNSTDSVFQTQISGYDDTGTKFIVVENEGKKIGPSGNHYDHLAGTHILWNQTLNNVPYTENFVLRFKYLYLRGPLEKPGGDPLVGNCSITVAIDGQSIHKIYLPYVESRNVWYDTGDIPITLTGASSTLNFTIGLMIDETLDLNAVQDLDNDGYEDGITNVVYVTSYIDDLSFISSTPPSFDEVAFNFTAGIDKVAISGTSGTASTNITKGGYWTTNPLTVGVEANVSVSLDYEARLLSHRFINSTSTTNPDEEGVAYSISYGTSADLTLNTYVGTIGDYENYTVIIRYPSDWDNVTVFNPFLTPVTGQCVISTGLTKIPDSVLVGNFGWWKLTLESPNYLESSSSQIFNPVSTSWSNTITFRPTNKTRIRTSLGTPSDTPIVDNFVNITWLLPNGTEWSTDSSTGNSIGEVNSTSRTFGGVNTSAGLWSAEIHWNNGSEIAFDKITFGMYHSATLTPVNLAIDTDAGLTVTNFLYYLDSDNGEDLLDDASIDANWSSTTVSFAPNLVKNWWEGDFDTSIVGGGVFTVVVNASKLYFDDVSCAFTITSTYATNLDVPLAGGLPVPSEINQTVPVGVRYELTNGTGISNALFDIDYTGPTNGLDITLPVETIPGNYTFDVISRITGTYSIQIIVSKDHHINKSKSFVIDVDIIDTNLNISAQSAIIHYDHTYKLFIEYSNSTGYGIAGATVEVVDPPIGVSIGSTVYEGNGNYSILFTPTDVGSFTIVIKANLTNYVTRFVSFALIVSEIPTSLTLNDYDILIGITDEYIIEIYYKDDNGSGIPGVNFTILNSTSGLTYTGPTDLGDGNYTLHIDPDLFGTYFVTLQASKEFYQGAAVSFTMVVEDTDTELIAYNGTAGFLYYGESYRLVVKYLNSTGHGLLGADVEIFSVNSTGLLNIDSTQYYGDGNYSIVLNPLNATTYTIVVRATLANHATQYKSLILTVTDIPTYFELNNTSAQIEFGEDYRLVIQYYNSSGHGITGATIRITNITPGSGLSYNPVQDLGDGNYSILLSPDAAMTFGISMNITLSNYVTQYPTFLLSVNPISTTLDAEPPTARISIDRNQTIQLHFTDDGGLGVEGATIAIIHADVEIKYSNVSELGLGYYNITVYSEEVGSYEFGFRASKENYWSETESFTLTVTLIPTSLETRNNIETETILFGQNYDLDVFYRRTDSNQSISGASITIIPSPLTDITWIITPYDDYYRITLIPDGVGTWTITINVNKINHGSESLIFVLTVISIDTIMVHNFIFSDTDILTYSETYSYTFNFTMIHNSTGIDDVNVTISGDRPDWLVVSPLGQGVYQIALTPLDDGVFSFTLRFQKEGFESWQTSTSIEVAPAIPLYNLTISPSGAMENEIITIEVQFINPHTLDAITDASVSYSILISGLISSSGPMIERADELGTYSTTYQLPNLQEGQSLSLIIEFEKDNYRLSESIGEEIIPQPDFIADVAAVAVPSGGLLTVFIAVVVGRSFYMRRRRRQIIEALEVKRRFDDLQSLIGVVVLHKDSGLSYYSQILKGGFDDAMISAFITAINQFRSEFEMGREHDEFQVIPISDIIRTVPTANLICSFITVTSPSPEMERKMIEFAKSVSFVFDSYFEERPMSVLEDHQIAIFDEIFDGTMYGFLLRRYKVVKVGNFPKGYRCIEWRVPHIEEDGTFTLEELAESMAECGIEEAQVYKMIYDAIEMDLIEGIDPNGEPEEREFMSDLGLDNQDI